jgi:hypothetical protein
MKTSSNRPSNYEKRSYLQKAAIVNRKLRQGDITKIAEAVGYSTTHVSDVISGKQFNYTILNRAFDMTRGRKSNAVRLAEFEA